jgi:hypothetical protein
VTDVAICLLTTKVGPWRVRIDKRHGQEAHHQEHVHISRTGLKGEYSWNKDGTRHDKHRFPASEQQIGRAKELAAAALKIPSSTLQFITAIDGGTRVSVSSVPVGARARSLLSIYVRLGQHLVLLGSPDGLVVFVSDEA